MLCRNQRVLYLSNYKCDRISFMYKFNSNDPNIDPCGTPHDTFSVGETAELLYTTILIVFY